MSKKPSSAPSFEIVLQVRDLDGKPTGKIKNFITDDPECLDSFFTRNGINKQEKKKFNNSNKTSKSITSKIIEKLEKNTKLPKGWDDANGVPLNYNTYLVATNIIRSLEDLISFMPRIIALSTGAVKLEFCNKKNEKELEITFNDQYSIEYFFYDPKSSLQEEKEIGVKEVWRIRELLMLLNKIDK